jgi:hypothetical protein
MQATYFNFALFCASPHIRVPNIYFRGHKRPVQTQLVALFDHYFYGGLRDDLCSLGWPLSILSSHANSKIDLFKTIFLEFLPT